MLDVDALQVCVRWGRQQSTGLELTEKSKWYPQDKGKEACQEAKGKLAIALAKFGKDKKHIKCKEGCKLWAILPSDLQGKAALECREEVAGSPGESPMVRCVCSIIKGTYKITFFCMKDEQKKKPPSTGTPVPPHKQL